MTKRLMMIVVAGLAFVALACAGSTDKAPVADVADVSGAPVSTEPTALLEAPQSESKWDWRTAKAWLMKAISKSAHES